jgi:hypothetical protein
VSLVGPDGRLLGGVAGLLIAASPIQVLFFSIAVITRNNTSSLRFSLPISVCFRNEVVFQIGVDLLWEVRTHCIISTGLLNCLLCTQDNDTGYQHCLC